MTRPGTARKKRANGLESRQRILIAAVEIAGERGYEGTSIATVSARCGLPASSIYWHFKDKDDLIAAVIERSFAAWLTAVELPGPDAGTPLERVMTMAANVAESLVEAPDFLRLGLMLALERRPAERRGRAVFLQVRDLSRRRITEMISTLFPSLDEDTVRVLTTYAVAGADGLFVHREVGGDCVDLVAMFEMHARIVYEEAVRTAAGARPSDRAAPGGLPLSLGLGGSGGRPFSAAPKGVISVRPHDSAADARPGATAPFVSAGQKVEARFGGLGSVSVTFV